MVLDSQAKTKNIAIVLKGIKPTPLNRLYAPIIKNGRPSIILSKESRETKKLIQMEAIRQMNNRQSKLIEGHISFYMDVDIKKIKAPDIDGLLKMLLDALENICYTNDKEILDLRVRKHFNMGEDKITIGIKEL